MKILLVTFEFPPIVGGIATYLSQLYQGLPATVRVFSPRAAAPYVWWMFPRWYPFYRSLRKYVIREMPDEIHVSHIIPVGMMSYWLWRRLNIPYVLIFHGTDLCAAHAQQRKWRRVRRIIQHARRCVVNSEATSRLFTEFLPDCAAPVVCTPGVAAAATVRDDDVASLRTEYDLGRRPVILFLARLIPRKGLLVALDALRILLQRAVISPILIIAGEGPERIAADQFVKLNHMESSVRFVGSISNEDKWKWYRVAHLFWFPAQKVAGEWEGFGTTSLEAQSMGCPAIVSALQGLPETVTDGVTGMVVQPTAAAFADATERLITSSAEWQCMRSAARAWAYAHSVEAQRELFSRQVLMPDADA